MLNLPETPNGRLVSLARTAHGKQLATPIMYFTPGGASARRGIPGPSLAAGSAIVVSDGDSDGAGSRGRGARTEAGACDGTEHDSDRSHGSQVTAGDSDDSDDAAGGWGLLETGEVLDAAATGAASERERHSSTPAPATTRRTTATSAAIAATGTRTAGGSLACDS